jgi:Pleckstrin homology domain
MSMESLNAYSHDHGSSIGFANSLSQTIIREENHSSTASFIDEEFQEHALILSGPPWAKEGVLKSKRHLDLNHKKSKDKQWTEAFVVIDKGQMRLFQFENHKVYHPSHQVGGGNWQKNANMIGSFLLRQTMAAALPPPGYSKSRQYVWMLTLPSGAVFVFEAGTQELVKEWISCANYWAARTSKEPLKAAVSNMEWGWGDCLISSDDDVTDDGRSVTESNPRSTFEAQRSPVSNGKATYGGDSRALKGDRVLIREWKPPQPSLMASSLKERDQLQVTHLSHTVY